MKNLFCTLILLFAMIFTTEAQKLDVFVTNNTPDAWTYKIKDVASGDLVSFWNPPIAANGGTDSGTIDAPVALDFDWVALNVGNGCNNPPTFSITQLGTGNQAVCSYVVSWDLTQATTSPFDFSIVVSID